MKAWRKRRRLGFTGAGSGHPVHPARGFSFCPVLWKSFRKIRGPTHDSHGNRSVLSCYFPGFFLPVFDSENTRRLLFWLLALLMATSQGGIQALSRSFFTRLIPPGPIFAALWVLQHSGKIYSHSRALSDGFHWQARWPFPLRCFQFFRPFYPGILFPAESPP